MKPDAIRIGQGFDAHRLVKGRKLVLAGVLVPFDKGLDGHSDADVVAHAVMDAVLGAMGERDIGAHFPPGDPAYKDADSMELLSRVAVMAEESGYMVAQVDATIIAEKPKLASYFPAMKENLARAARAGAISIKATTTEGMGFVGRGEGMAAMAVALLVKMEDAGA